MVNWWAIVYGVVALSVLVHFGYRLAQQEAETTLQADRRPVPSVIIIKPEGDNPARFQFLPRQ